MFTNSFKGLPRILIIDDDQESIDIIKTQLPKGLFHFDASYGKDEALEFISHLKRPDLILLDINLGGENSGIEICKIIKENPDFSNVPIIFLTADSEAEMAIKAYRAGGADYIVKPFSKDELNTRVTTQIDLYRRKIADEIRAKIKKDLLHLLTHELINPILGAKSLFEIILSNPNKLKEIGPTILDTLGNSLQMIEESRKLVTQEETVLTFSQSFFPLKDAIDGALSFLKTKLNEKNITMDLQIEKDLEIYGDQEIFLNGIFIQILNNSINFSQRDSKIIVKSSTHDESIKLEIIDQGIGIPKSMLKDIYDVSKMTQRKGTEGEALGKGLGLAEVKNCLSLFGSEMSISSKEKKEGQSHHGTVITLFLNGKLKDIAA